MYSGNVWESRDFSHSCCGVFFLIAFRSKPGVPFRFFLCLNNALAEANRCGVLC